MNKYIIFFKNIGNALDQSKYEIAAYANNENLAISHALNKLLKLHPNKPKSSWVLDSVIKVWSPL